MTSLITIIAVAVFGAGIAVGIVVVVSAGVRREERRFAELQRLREARFFQTGEMPAGYLPQDPPDGLTWGARRMTGLWIRRQPTAAIRPAGEDLLI